MIPLRMKSCAEHGSETPITVVAGSPTTPMRASFVGLPPGFCLGGGQPHQLPPDAPTVAMHGSGQGVVFTPATQEGLTALFSLPTAETTPPADPAVLITSGVAGKITIWDVTPPPAGADTPPMGHCRFSGRDGRWWRPSSISVNAQIGVSMMGRLIGDMTYTKLYQGQYEGSLWLAPGLLGESANVLLVWGGIWWEISEAQTIVPVSVVIGLPLMYVGRLRVLPRG